MKLWGRCTRGVKPAVGGRPPFIFPSENVHHLSTLGWHFECFIILKRRRLTILRLSDQSQRISPPLQLSDKTEGKGRKRWGFDWHAHTLPLLMDNQVIRTSLCWRLSHFPSQMSCLFVFVNIFFDYSKDFCNSIDFQTEPTIGMPSRYWRNPYRHKAKRIVVKNNRKREWGETHLSNESVLMSELARCVRTEAGASAEITLHYF